MGRNARTGLLMTLPALLLLGVTVLYPIAWSISLSLQSFDIVAGGAPPEFVGLDNYARVSTSPAFLTAMRHTVGYVATTLAVEFVLGFGIALLLRAGWRGSKVFRVIVALPLLVAPIVAAMSFRFLFASGYGFINEGIAALGLTPPAWFADVWLARTTILVANLWTALPFVVLVLLAGLVSIPKQTLEAARVDGASRAQVFRLVELPLLRPAILIILIIRLADAFRVFDAVYVLTGGGPGGATEVMSSYLYKAMFLRTDFAGAAAASVLFVLVMAATSLLLFRLLRPKEA